mmetsp:Transcript_51/g.68  ORF Transcript_51/g.68 Transcript_51/m.68 type:complete len:259 (+) Transcript_51:66-842(+)
MMTFAEKYAANLQGRKWRQATKSTLLLPISCLPVSEKPTSRSALGQGCGPYDTLASLLNRASACSTHVRCDPSRTNSIDAHVGKLAGQFDGEHVQGCLGDAIGWCSSSHTRQTTGPAAHVDNSWVIRFIQKRTKGQSASPRTIQIRIHRFLHIVEICGRCSLIGVVVDAGVVDQYIQHAIFFLDKFLCSLYTLGRRYVQLCGHHFRRTSQLLGHLLSFRDISRTEHHCVAQRCHLSTNFLAYPTVPTSYQRYLSQCHC